MTETTNHIVGNRYQLIDKIGQGAMGEVFKAFDRLTGQTIALKRVIVPNTQLNFASRFSQSDTVDFRLALAQEFRTLASLRHPNIISVLDYGFDEQRQPYFTMDLLESAQTIIEFGRHKDEEFQVRLLAQMLQALAYLHRRGIIHRDLKPDNTLVVNGLVKVLDFGLAVTRDYLADHQEMVGTIAYMAPEVLQGGAASEAADLYAVGVIAYELFTGQHPFTSDNLSQLIQNILAANPDIDLLEIEEPLKATLERLLAKLPEERYQDATELIRLYTASIDQSAETVMIRESYLQAAAFVGRSAELTILTTALNKMVAGKGSAWLVGGESGVGKSRLLDELRTQALVNGALVLKGQAIAESGAPYLLWRDALRFLCLQTDLSDREASVLKPLILDLPALLNRSVPDAPDIDPQAAQSRLLGVIEAIFRKQSQPIVLLLEDLQWSNESLTLLKRLNRIVGELPLLIVGNYRDDERPDLPQELPEMHAMKLHRLNGEAIADLSAAMLGEQGRQPQVVDLLQRESEGNIFFIVEVMRVLAEEAGQLDQVGIANLPSKIFAGGIQAVVQRRLNRLPAASRPLLQAAAVTGREIDAAVLRIVDPKTDIDSWLTTCAEASVLEVQNERWRFAHDKLREGLLMDLSDEHCRTLHRQVAEALERTYVDQPTQFASLAHHWELAGDEKKEAHYAALAGQQAVASSAYREAIPFLVRALSLAETVGTPKVRLILLEEQLGQAYYGIGDLAEAGKVLKRALTLLGDAPARSSLMLGFKIAGQVLRQLWHRVRLNGLRYPFSAPQNRDEILIASRMCERLAQIAFFDNQSFNFIYYVIQALNEAESVGQAGLPEQLREYATIALGLSVVPLHPVTRWYFRQADRLLPIVNDLGAAAWVTELNGLYQAGLGAWDKTEAYLLQSQSLAEQIGDERRITEVTYLRSIFYFLCGRLDDGYKLWETHYTRGLAANDPQVIGTGAAGLAQMALRRGEYESIMPLMETGVLYLEKINDQTNLIISYGVLAKYSLYQEDLEAARRYTDKTLALISQSTPTAFYTLEGYASAADVCLMLYEAHPTPDHWKMAHVALKHLNHFARVFDIAKSRAAAFQGWYHWLDGKPDKAMFIGRQAIAHAQRLTMPYDEGIAHYHLGRFLSRDDPQRMTHLKQAADIFERLKVLWELDLTQQALSVSAMKNKIQ